MIAGAAIAVLASVVLVGAWARAPRRHCFGAAGWSGLTVFAGCAILVAALQFEPPFLGALAWSGYVVAVDSAVYSIRGRSMLRSRPESFLWLAVLSIFLWLPFEWCNLRLAAWYRAGYPPGLERHILLGWSYACIWPALLETADLVLAGSRWPASSRPQRAAPGRSVRLSATLVGAGCLILPHIVPRLDAGEHLVALTAVCFLLLLDPLNLAAGRPSLWADWVSGSRARCAALALSGALCGILADCLNHWSEAKWHSISTLGAEWKLFVLPLPAYLLLPAFGLQAFAMHAFAAGVLKLPSVELPTWTAPRSDASHLAREGRNAGSPGSERP